MNWQLALTTLCSGAVAFGGWYALLRVGRDMRAMADEEMANERPDALLATSLAALGCLWSVSLLPVTLLSFVIFAMSLAALLLGPWS